MTPRFRIVAGPNGSGKTTLMRRLAEDYAVNFYDAINADDIFAEISRTGAFAPKTSVDAADLASFAAASSYADDVKRPFVSGAVRVENDLVRFSPEAVNTYTVALFANFIQSLFIRAGRSFSHETVFSHPSKLSALKAAKDAGFRTYLYFVATDSPEVNAARVANRAALGGHSVPPEKIVSRYWKSLENISRSFGFLSRAYFFDNGGFVMRYLGEWNAEDGFKSNPSDGAMSAPAWFERIAAGFGGLHSAAPSGKAALALSSAEASKAAIRAAASAGLTVTAIKDGRIVRIPAKEIENVQVENA